MSADGIYILVCPRSNNNLQEYRVALCTNVQSVHSRREIEYGGGKYDLTDIYRVIYFGKSQVHLNKVDAFNQAVALEEEINKKGLPTNYGIRFIRSEQAFPVISLDEAYRMSKELLL
jgi:hypothetical protein